MCHLERIFVVVSHEISMAIRFVSDDASSNWHEPQAYQSLTELWLDTYTLCNYVTVILGRKGPDDDLKSSWRYFIKFILMWLSLNGNEFSQ